jgi:hypothetical protein
VYGKIYSTYERQKSIGYRESLAIITNKNPDAGYLLALLLAPPPSLCQLMKAKPLPATQTYERLKETKAL